MSKPYSSTRKQFSPTTFSPGKAGIPMKIKMVDVARHLGISKATVSLAVNGKPGVNEQTRQKVLECIKELENQRRRAPGKLLLPESRRTAPSRSSAHHQPPQTGCLRPELDLWTEVLRTFDTEARTRGYLYGLSYINETEYETQCGYRRMQHRACCRRHCFCHGNAAC